MNLARKAAGLLAATTLAITGLALTSPASQASPATSHTTATAPVHGPTPKVPKGLRPMTRSEVQQALGTSSAVPGYTYIVNNHSGQCMAVSDGNKAAGTPIIQWPCAYDADHYWQTQFQFYDDVFGYAWFYIVNYNSGQCLAVPGGSLQPNTQLIQWPCSYAPDHYWAFLTDNTGGMYIENYNSGQVVSVRGGSAQAGGQVIQYTYGGYVDQYWHTA